MANNYEIKLGINFDNKELKNIKTQLNGLTDNTHRIRIDIDNSRLLKQIEHAKRELKELNSTNGNQPSLTVNTKSLEDSLSRVADVIDEVKKSLGTLDDKSGMKSLLSSVNQIANALGRVTDESETLVKSLSALSKKDFSVNFDVKFGGSNSVSNSAAYGNIVRNEIIPELKRQEQAIGNYLAKHYKTNELSALNKLAGDSLGGMNGIIDLLDRLESPLKKGESLDGRMQEFQNFFNIIRKAADIENIKLPSFDKQYDELIKNAYDIKNGVKEAESSVEKFEDVLKRAFGSGVNVDGLAEQLEPIITDLGEIKRTLDSLSKNNSIDGLTASFNRLSDVLDKIVANFDAIKNISAGLPNMSSVNSGVADNIEKVSDDSANTVVRNEKKKQEAYKATADAVVYHAGIISKLNKAETNGRFVGSKRGTGYYGTGHYFVDSATKHELDNNNTYNKLPYTSVDMSQYDNLFKATTDEIADGLHVFLENLTAFTQGSDKYSVEELFSEFEKVFSDTTIDIKEFGSRLEQLKTFMSNSYLSDRSDSVSTQFMKSLGYGGVDTRGTRYADTRYGTVIYDLKEESILQANITDELQKQGQMLEKINYEKGQVFDKGEDDRIQSILDEQALQKEIKDEFKKSFDSTNLDNVNSELNNAQNRLEEVENIIENLQYDINNADKEAYRFAKDMAELGLDMSDEDIEDYKKRFSENYRNSIDELSKEKAELQSKIPVLEEVYNKENQLANEAYEQAKKIVEQRHLEAQQAKETANVVAQNEEKKQSAIQETAKTYDKISKNTSLVRDGGDFEKVFEESNQAAQEAQRHFQELLADEKAVVSVTEQFDNMNSLQSFVVNIQRASGEVESLRYSIRNLAEEGEEDDFRFIYQGASSSDVKVEKQLEARIKKANDLRTKLDKIKSDYSDMGAAKPIKDSDHINALDKQYRKVEKAIEDIRNADNTMSSSVISNAEKQRAVLESMVKEYRNAETVATSLRSKDINTVGATYDSDLDVLISKMRKDGIYTSGFEKGAENLRSILSNAVVSRDKSGLVDFLNGLDKLEAGYKRASAAKKEFNRSESVGIDSSKLNQRIENLRRISPEIDKFETEINGARVTVKSLLSDLDNIKVQGDFTVVNKKFKAFEAAAEAAGITVKETVTNTKSDFNRLISITKEMGNIKVKIAGLDADENAGEIERLKTRLSELGDEYNELFAATSKNLSSGQLDELTQEAVEASNKLDMVNAKIDDMKAKLANAEIRDIKLKITTGDFDEDISKIDGRLNNLSGASEKLTASVEETKAAFAEMERLIGNNDDEVIDVEKLREARDKYNQALEKTNNLLRMQERAEKVDNDRLKLEDDRKLFQSNIDTWLKKNSAAAGRFGEAMQKLRADAESCDRIRLNHLSKQFKLLDNLADKAGLKIESLGDRIKGKFKEYSAYFSVAEVFMKVAQALKNMFDQVLVIDTAMTELKKVTDETDASYNRFLSNASTRAKAIGTTIDGLVTSTADFARLGYEFKDAQKLAEVANIYAVVGDDIDSVETATESLISTMTAFGVEASNSMSIVDKFNIIGNNFAISSGGIGEALERSASSMAAANNSLDETIALITAANTVVQDADSVGTAFKTISMRIRGAKTDLEEAGLDAEGMASSTAKLREEILALSGVDIMLDNTTFKSTYKIMEELSTKWQDLTDIQQASVTELIAGKRQGNIVSSLMTNFDIAQNALQTSLKSSGSAMEEHEKYMDSLEAKMSQLKAAWQGFSQTFLDSSFLKGGVDILKTLVELLDKLVDNFGVLGTAGLGVIGTGIFQYFKFIKNDGAKTIETIKNVTDAINNITNSATNVTEITSDIVDSTGKAMSTVTNVSNASKTASNIVDSTGKTITKVADAALDGADAMTDLGNAVTKTTGGFKAFMKTPAGIASAIGLVVAAIGLAYNAYKKAKEAAAEARQEAIAASDEFLDAADSFEQAYIKYSDKTDLTAEEEAELEAAIKGTVDALGDKSSALQGVVNSSNDYLASLERISKEELKAADVAARAKKIAAEKELEETAKSSSGFLGILGKESTVDIASGVNPNSEEVAKIAKEIGEKYYKTLSSSNSGVTAKVGFELSSDASAEEIVDYYNMLLEYQEKLSDPEIGLENSSAYDNATKAINAMSDAIDVYTGGVYDAVKAQYQLLNGIPKTTEEYVKMREGILNSEDIKGASFDSKKIIANSLDSEYGKLFDISAAEVQARKFVGIISGYGDGTKDGTNEIGTVETFLNVRTAVNNNECTVGKYLSELNNVTSMTEKFSDEEKKEFNLAFGLDVDPIKEQYDNIYNYISRNYLDKLDTADMPVSAAQEYIDYETKRIQEILGNLSAIELKALANIKTEIDWENINVDKILAQIKEEAELQEVLTFKLNISAEAEGIDALNTAMKESVDAAGLSSESFAILKSRYAELDDYDPSKLFERTSQGIHLNREELNKLEKQLADSKIKEVDKDLDALTKAYADVTKKIRDCSDETERHELVAEQLKYANKIKELSEMRSQYEGLTSAYNNWVNAQESGEEGDIYDDVIEKLESAAELRKKGLVGTNEFAAAVGFMSGKDTSSMTVDEIVKAYDEATPKMERYFTDSSKGAQNLLNDLNGINKEWAYINENGEWKLNIPLEEAAKELGISVDALEAVLGKGTDYGLTINYDSVYEVADSLETLYTKAESANNKLKELGHTDFTFSFKSTNAEDLEMQIEKAQEIVDLINEADLADDGKINFSVEGAEESKRVLETLMRQKQEVTKPAFMEVSYSVLGDADLGNAIKLLQELQSYKNTYDVQLAIDADTSGTESKIQAVIGEINTLKTENPQVFADLNLNTEEFNTALNTLSGNINAKAQLDPASLETVQTALSDINAKVLADVGIGNTDALNALEGQADIVPVPTTKDVGDDFTGSAVIKVAPNTFDLGEAFYGSGQIGITPYLTTKKLTVEVESKEVSEVNGTASVNGTAFANGTTGKAFKQGSWSTKDSGTALVGELGMETLVRDGRFYTIGDTGAEFVQYRKGDIIFNHEQTKELFEHGKVTSGGGRGKMFANGTAFAEGTAFYDGNNVAGGGTLWYLQSLEENAKKAAKEAKKKGDEASKKAAAAAEKAAAEARAAVIHYDSYNTRDAKGGGTLNGGVGGAGAGSGSGSGSSSSAAKEEFKETIDWIEIAISRIEREIDNLDKKANNVYKSWSSRSSALTKEITKVRDEIQLQSSAYDEYMSEANSVGLSSSWAKKVREGKVDIETIKDEALAEKIKNYQNWYEKALQCKDAIEDLKETESALYAQRFENIQNRYDGILQGYEHTETMLNEYISQAEEQGYIVSKKYYQALINNEKSNVDQLVKEQAALIQARDEAVDSGAITKYSEEW